MATSVVLKKKHNDDGAKQDAKEAKGVTAVKALHSEWRTNLGELVLDIRTGKFHWEVRARSFDVVVLGEFSLFCLTPSGDVCFHKRLGFHPSSLCLGIDGMVVSLDDDGRLSVNYLGTDPPTTSVMASDAKEVNYEEMDEEHRTLLNIIRRSQGERRTEPKERVLLRAQVPALLDPPSLHTEADLRTFTGRENVDDNVTTDGDVVTGPDHKPVALTMRVYVTYTGSNVLNNVTIAITPPANVIVCGPSSILLDSIDGKAGTPLILPIVLRPSASVMPSSLDVIISAAYTLESGQPRTSLCTVKLPMCMMCRLIPPVKASTFKVLFRATPDWAKQVTGSAANVLSFQYYNGIDVTILVSKNAGRYRIQSTELDALWMVSNELVDRLQLLHVQQTQGNDDDDPSALPPPLHIQYQEPLPLADFFAAIDEHFAVRTETAELHAELNDRAHQFRVIQKRLLVRYKDRSPSPLNCLDMLLHGTYSQLLDLSRRVHVSANRLACSVHLLLMLIRYKFDLDDDNFAVLSAHLSPRVADAWEESTETAMTDLLKTALAVKKENAAAVAVGVPVELVLPEDTKKLKKHITIVCDRLGKGGRLVGGATSAAAAAGKSDANDDDGGKEEKDSGAKP
ncbi:hypothetical protein DYB37_004755 [Aphanomyces astaci]|uniref:PTHB1 C-terminal domain-containing protein n=1 Tax=Aphanomyces astaci TaxID=112090 RepID=A0A3R7BSF1_APHAT|nr:hypothetical protein DYB37_004755 [Aphanomyces astaci]